MVFNKYTPGINHVIKKAWFILKFIHFGLFLMLSFVAWWLHGDFLKNIKRFNEMMNDSKEKYQ